MNLRKAEPADQPTIRRMVWQAGINPLQLDWRRFTLAVDDDGRVTGCIQVKPHGDGTRELASLVVLGPWRGRGIARRLVEHALAQNPPPLYLTCRSGLERLYERFGFRALAEGELPPYFRRLARLARVFGRMWGMRETLSVMRWDGPRA